MESQDVVQSSSIKIAQRFLECARSLQAILDSKPVSFFPERLLSFRNNFQGAGILSTMILSFISILSLVFLTFSSLNPHYSCQL